MKRELKITKPTKPINLVKEKTLSEKIAEHRENAPRHNEEAARITAQTKLIIEDTNKML